MAQGSVVRPDRRRNRAWAGHSHRSYQDLPERHRSMRIMLRSSWQLLSQDERNALMRLSVFQGKFSLGAAEHIVGISLLSLVTLVEKSLLQVAQSGYYRMHELLRQYSAEQLGKQKEVEEEVLDRHADYYCDYLHRRHGELKCSQQQNALIALNMESGNLRSAGSTRQPNAIWTGVGKAIDGLGRFYEWTGNLAGGVLLLIDCDDPVISLIGQLRQVRPMRWPGQPTSNV